MHKICLYNNHKTGQIVFSEKMMIAVSKPVSRSVRHFIHTQMNSEKM